LLRQAGKIQWIQFFISSGIIISVLLFNSSGGASNVTLNNFYNQDPKIFMARIHKEFKPGVALDCFSQFSEWEKASWMHTYIDNKLKAMIGHRCIMFTLMQTHFNIATQNSFLDTEIFPKGTLDAIAYFPRGAQIGIFSPFPDKWLYNFNHPWSFFYTVVPFETLILYLGLLALIVWVAIYKKWTIAIPIAFACIPMTIYGTSVPFLGSLYRFRYPWWMILICIGLAAVLTLFKTFFSRPQTKLNV
jgi:hypothetical protein